MPTPQNSTLFAVKGQAFNVSGVVKAAGTGNPITGGLTNPVAWISKDDGMFVGTQNAPVERNSSGWVSLDLTAAEMNASKVDLMIGSGDTVMVYDCVKIATGDLSPETTMYDLEPVIRIERLWLNIHSYLWNQQQNSKGAGAVQRVFNRLGLLFAQAQIQRYDTYSVRGRFGPPGSGV